MRRIKGGSVGGDFFRIAPWPRPASRPVPGLTSSLFVKVSVVYTRLTARCGGSVKRPLVTSVAGRFLKNLQN